jgi:DNA-binding MarR family transcriptional regulator
MQGDNDAQERDRFQGSDREIANSGSPAPAVAVSPCRQHGPMTDSSPAAPTRRTRSRRDRRRSYLYDRPVYEQRLPPPDPADTAVVASRLLADAGSLRSALRAPMRDLGLDHRLGLLLLAFPQEGYRLNIAHVAWRMGITTGGASRLVDNAEARALVERHFSSPDRRATQVRLTHEGHALRAALYDVIRGGLSTDRGVRPSFGIRSYLDRFRPPAARRGFRDP